MHRHSAGLVRPADVALQRAQALTDEHEINVYLPELHERRARLALARGDAATAKRGFQEVLRLYTEMDAPVQVARLQDEAST